MEPIYTEEYKGFTINIFQDDVDQDGPREWDNLGTMVCFHNHYNLGDKHKFSSPGDLREVIESKDIVSLPLYLYDHGGITMSTSPFSCLWDSGKVGYIFAEKNKALKEFNSKHWTNALALKVLIMLEREVKIYDDFLTGNVYGFEVKQGEEDIDSCWGFYRDYDLKYGALSAARSIVDNQPQLALLGMEE